MIINLYISKKIFYFSVQTDHKLEHNKTDLITVDKETTKCHIIDVTCPVDTLVEKREKEKVEQYQELK